LFASFSAAAGFDSPPLPPPQSGLPGAGFWAGWWPWCINTPPRPVRAAPEDGGGDATEEVTGL
jgi:hypothetical protein